MAGMVTNYMENHKTHFIRGATPTRIDKLPDEKLQVTYQLSGKVMVLPLIQNILIQRWMYMIQ